MATADERRDLDTGFEDFVRARGAALLRFALMLTGELARAEDLVQSVFATAYPRWSRIAAMAAPEAYLRTVLVHEHLKWWRRRSNREVPATMTGDVAGRDDLAADHADRDAAWRLLGRLPRRQRAVLALRYYEDLPDDDIAAILGCTASTVRSQAARGLATLRAAAPAAHKEAQP
jgi:RNA polymerase sigma-70 factor (sigma-E family)